jgi:hypothetical protein
VPDRIVDRFSNGHHNVAIDIIIKIEFILGIINEALNDPDVFFQ